MGFFGGLIFGPGIFWALLEDQGILLPFDHTRHLKSGVPLGFDPCAPNFSIRKVDKLISKLILCQNILHQAFLFKCKFSFYKDFLTAKGDQSFKLDSL